MLIYVRGIQSPMGNHIQQAREKNRTKSEAMEAPDSETEQPEQLILRRKGLTTLQIDPLRFAQLRILSASHNALVDINAVSHLVALEELNVNHNQLTDLSPVIQCNALQVLLAANNQVSEIEGFESLPSLQRLSLFQNILPDLEILLATLQACPNLDSLDLGGNPCFHDASQRHGILRALPRLRDLDGEVLTNVDRQLAAEFFLCAEEFGLEERPGSSCGLRPKTAPVSKPELRTSRSQSRPRSARRGSRSSSKSPERGGEVMETPNITEDKEESLVRFQQYVQALQLRLRTTQVDCENLTRQIQQLRKDAQEPVLGSSALQRRLAELEEENSSMHKLAEANRKMHLEVSEKEATLNEKRQALGLPERPGTRSGRPGTAAVQAVLSMSEPSTVEGFKSKCRSLKRDLEVERERTLQLRAKACSRVLGREVSPPRS